MKMLWILGMASHSKTCIDGPFCRTSVNTTFCKRASVNSSPLPAPVLLHLVAEEPCGCSQGARLISPKFIVGCLTSILWMLAQ
jgi:hypothetical protein